MTFAGMNTLAILVAALAGFLVGGLWYTALARPWAAAQGKVPTDFRPRPTPFIIAALANLAMAWTLAGTVGHLGQVTVRSALISAAFLWFGFVLTTTVVNNAFQGHRPMLSVIDAGHWLAVLFTMGLVIGLFGV